MNINFLSICIFVSIVLVICFIIYELHKAKLEAREFIDKLENNAIPSIEKIDKSMKELHIKCLKQNIKDANLNVQVARINAILEQYNHAKDHTFLNLQSFANCKEAIRVVNTISQLCWVAEAHHREILKRLTRGL